MRATLPFLIVAMAVAAPAFAQSTRQPAAPVERSADDPDKMICRRFQKTGSLVASTRECHTKREWDRARDELNAARSQSTNCGGQTATCS